jgi:hypothetical protein
VGNRETAPFVELTECGAASGEGRVGHSLIGHPAGPPTPKLR